METMGFFRANDLVSTRVVMVKRINVFFFFSYAIKIFMKTIELKWKWKWKLNNILIKWGIFFCV